MPQALHVKDAQQKLKQYMATKVFEAVQSFERKHSEKIAGFAIVAIVAYLFIAQ
jgi:hypothetical protein